jgi:hypothetical protein
MLGDLINWLEKQPKNGVIAEGFGAPMSYRGYYEDVAFAPERNAKISDMLLQAKYALGQTFTGYKGGKYKMNEYTDCWISEYGMTSDDKITNMLLRCWEKELDSQ